MRLAAVLFLGLALVACGVTRQARDVKQSGFLGDYSRLEPGPDGGARKLYQNPNAKLGSYDKILLAPVTIWTGEGSEMNDLAKEDRQRVANRLFELLHARLSKDYAIVTAPGPGVLRVEAAITSAERSYPVLDTVSTIVPIGLGISTLKAVATGKPTFVGEATAEMRLSDAATGEVLAEAVDSRVGTKNPTGLFDKWEDVDSALTYWTDRLGYKLCVERGAAGCVAP